jgi:hypothetical protein
MLTGTAGAKIADHYDELEFDEYVPLDEKTYDVTNYCESIGSICSCCGPLTKSLILTDEEAILKHQNWCVTRKQKRPYAQLGSVDVHQQCGMCFTIGSDLAPANEKGEGGMAIGCGCDEALSREIASVMQERKEKRGNVAQVRKLDYLYNKLIGAAVKAPLLLNKLGKPYRPETLPQEEKPKVFGREEFDMTNYFEMICGCVTKNLVLDKEEATLTINDLCNSRVQKREYAQLGNVERKKSCVCCYAVSSELGELAPAFGCDQAKVENVKAHLTDRMMQRGNIGQIRKQEKMMQQVTELNKEIPMLAASLGCAEVPQQKTMDRNCGNEKTGAPAVNDAPKEEGNDIFAREDAIDVTNTCGSVCGLICTCCILGLTKQTVKLENEHLVIATKNNCDDSEVKLPYAQLGSVDINKSCCCCWGVNDFVPGCGCSKTLVEELHDELQARKVKRGNIAQVKQLEKMQWQSFMMDTSALEMVEKQGMVFPPDQNTMEATWPPGKEKPIENVLRKTIPHFDAATKFEKKMFDISNYCEMCSSCLCCCGPTKTTMWLEEEEMFITKENLCFRTNSRTPYAQLGSVETEQVCGCCLEIPEVANPKCGCDKDTVEEVAKELQERKVKRGNIAQLKMQENLITSAIKLDAKLDMLMMKHGVEYPPSEATMNAVFGSTLEAPVPGMLAAQQMLAVKIPDGMQPGQQLQVQNHNGGMFTFTIPPNADPGKTIQVLCPSPNVPMPTPSVVGVPTPIP